MAFKQRKKSSINVLIPKAKRNTNQSCWLPCPYVSQQKREKEGESILTKK
jgi:hypothetical protein